MAESCGKEATLLFSKGNGANYTSVELDPGKDLVVPESEESASADNFILGELAKTDATGVVIKLVGWARRDDPWFPVKHEGKHFLFIERENLRPMWKFHKELGQTWLYGEAV